jgi:carbon monoxide dehydrogenase subunit G
VAFVQAQQWWSLGPVCVGDQKITKIGPVKACFRGNVHLTDFDPPNGYKISGEGDGGVAGSAKGGATVTLTEKDGGTQLTYNVEAQIGGKLAQLGQRLVNGAAKEQRTTSSRTSLPISAARREIDRLTGRR